MNDFLQKNSWALVIAFVTLIGSYALYGYRIGVLEAQIKDAQQSINTSEAVQNQIQLSLRSLEKDMEYTNKQLDRFLGPLPQK